VYSVENEISVLRDALTWLLVNTKSNRLITKIRHRSKVHVVRPILFGATASYFRMKAQKTPKIMIAPNKRLRIVD
jgi:hypothetical protein